MKTTLFLLAILLASLLSCKSDEEKNRSKMKEIVIKELNDNTFKNNATVEIFEYSNDHYTIKDENYLDTLRLGINFENVEHFKSIANTQIELVKNLSQQVRLYKDMFGTDDNITQIKMEDYKEALKKLRQYGDSLRYYVEQDSLIRLRITQRKNAKPIYYYKAYIKATSKDNNSGKTENFADTIWRVFDEKLNTIKY